MHVVAVKTPVSARPMVVRPAMGRPRLSAIVRSSPSKNQIDEAIKDAQEACEGGDTGEW